MGARTGGLWFFRNAFGRESFLLWSVSLLGVADFDVLRHIGAHTFYTRLAF
jgi:hypothetical protein